MPSELLLDYTQFTVQAIRRGTQTTHSDDTIRTIRQILPADHWPKYTETARIRVENRLIESIREGRYDASRGRCTSGSLGTWAAEIAVDFILRRELLWTLICKLESDDSSQREYVFMYFFHLLPKMIPTPTPRLTAAIENSLKNGDSRLHGVVSGYCGPQAFVPIPGWVEVFGPMLEQFVPASNFNAGITDDDVPF